MNFRVPRYYRKFLMKMGMLVLIFSLCRIVFYVRNSASFPDAGIGEFIWGFWFDLITTALLFLPIAAIELFPNKNRAAKWFVLTTSIFSGLAATASIFINLIDVEYFAFSSARSNSSLFTMLGYGDDLRNQLPSYLTDYWYILLLLILFAGVFIWLSKKINSRQDDSATVSLTQQIIIYIISAGLLIFIARGGPVHKPIRTTQAAKYTDASHVQLILNSAFTVINTWGSSALEEKDYMPNEEALTLFNPVRSYKDGGDFQGQNVCIIILESFSNEFIGALNGEDESWTPFFDQLIDSSLVFHNTYANGKKSIDAVPSIVSSIPKFMSDEYLLSNYASNQIESLPQHLEKIGYSSGFFHGATNGSMNFDAFCSTAGFDNYYGRSEYDNDEHFDGTWGIYDEEFMGWSVEQFGKMKEPFFTTLFTISSHPPYSIPQRYKSAFKTSDNEMHMAIQYTDMALEKFFEKAQKQEWFKRTLFVITADHTPNSRQSKYLTDNGKMNVPLLFYHPANMHFKGTAGKVIGHIDIMPSILHLLGYDRPFFSFGHSAFDSEQGYTFSEIGDKKMLFANLNAQEFLLLFQNEETTGMFALKDIHQKNNLKDTKRHNVVHLEKRLKAIIQVYNHALIRNQMTHEKFNMKD